MDKLAMLYLVVAQAWSTMLLIAGTVALVFSIVAMLKGAMPMATHLLLTTVLCVLLTKD